MNRFLFKLMMSLALIFYGSAGLANTILGVETFETDSSVTIPSDNTIEFIESADFISLFCWNDSFFVPNNAGTISFDWEIVRGSVDDDYLTFILVIRDDDITNEIHEMFPTNPPTDPKEGDVISDHFFMPLTLYRGQYVYMEWGFNEGRLGNNTAAGSIGTISNIKLSTPASIPTMNEWGMILMSLVLAGSAFWMIRRRQLS